MLSKCEHFSFRSTNIIRNQSFAIYGILFIYIHESGFRIYTLTNLDPTTKHNCVPEYSFQIILPLDFSLFLYYLLKLIHISPLIIFHQFEARGYDVINLQEKQQICSKNIWVTWQGKKYALQYQKTNSAL
jgi:hypothetical protein